MDMYNSTHVHQLLRGGIPSYPHSFSSEEMESLGAMCDTFIPSISPQFITSQCSVNGSNRKTAATINVRPKPEESIVEDFYNISGSWDGRLPSHIAGLISRHCSMAAVILIRFVLLCLYTRLGTLLFCGKYSLSETFPYILNFSAISVVKRQKILLNWSLGTGSIFDPFFQLIFKTFKASCLYAFYSTADEKGRNSSWKAIGYSPSPSNIPITTDPNLDRRCRPLEGGIIDVGVSSTSKIHSFLGDAEAGFDVSYEKDVDGGGGGRSLGSARKVLKVKCDVVVVGSGAGGGVAAGKLAQAGYKVLVVEKGKYFAGSDLSLIEGPSMEQMYARGGLLATADNKVSILAGATVGGGSAINWCASIRTPVHVLREWSREQKLSLFESEEYERAMDEVCARLGVNSNWEKEGFQNLVLRKGCSALGYEVTDVAMNATAAHFSCGVSCCFGCKTGDKKGTCSTWLVDAVYSGNARILANCEATQVVWMKNHRGRYSSKHRKRRAVGVLCRAGGQGEAILVEAKATVVACGALMTPGLLRDSGLKNPNIGRNLHLHPVRMAWGYFPPGVEPEGNCYEGGIITAMCKEGAKWDGSGYGTIIQTPALAPGSFGALMPWVSGADMKERMMKYQRTTHLFTLTRDRGSGNVGRDMDVHYKLTDARDKENLDDSLARALRILIAAGATEVGTHHNDGRVFRIEGTGTGEAADEIEKYLKDVRDNKGWCPLISAHQMGSCRMGMDPATSCVDKNGETWEVEGLFVSDTSVFPTALGVNPMITVEAIALCISQRVSQFLQQN